MTATHAKAAGYARLSVNRAGSASIEVQKRGIRALATEYGLTLREPIEVDAGISGAKDETARPGYARWLAAALSGDAQVLIAYHMDRATRAGLAEFVKLTALIEATGARLLTVADRLDSADPNFETRAGMDAVFAQRYRKEVQKKVTDRHASDRRNGVWHPAPPWPYGSKTPAGKLVPDPAAVAVLREMVSRINDGWSYRRIGTDLAARGVGGFAWTAALVQKVLRRPILAGWHTHGGALVRDDNGDLSVFADPPALGASEYEALQATLDRRSQPRGLGRGPATGQKPAHPLAGLLRCTCGAKLWADVRTRSDGYAATPVWRCRRRQANKEACDQRAGIPIAEVEKRIYDMVLYHIVFSDPDDLWPVAEALAAQQSPASTAARRAALDAVAAAEAALADLEAARYERGEFAGREARWAELHARARARLAAAQEGLAAAPRPPDLGALLDVQTMEEALDRDLARWARLFAVAITVGPDRLEAVWR